MKTVSGPCAGAWLLSAGAVLSVLVPSAQARAMTLDTLSADALLPDISVSADGAGEPAAEGRILIAQQSPVSPGAGSAQLDWLREIQTVTAGDAEFDGFVRRGCVTAVNEHKEIVAEATAFARARAFLDDTVVQYSDHYVYDHNPTDWARDLRSEPGLDTPLIDGAYFWPEEPSLLLRNTIVIFRSAAEGYDTMIRRPNSIPGEPSRWTPTSLSGFQNSVMTIGHESGHSELGLLNTPADEALAEERGVELLDLCTAAQ